MARAEQGDFALMLADQGMGLRAIAPIVGRSDRQIRRNIAGASNDAPDPDPMNVNIETGESYDAPDKIRGWTESNTAAPRLLTKYAETPRKLLSTQLT